MLDKDSNKPMPNGALFKYHDLSIILHYKNKAIEILEYYKPAKNFYWVKKQINYHMRYSLLFTLAKKHRTSIFKIIQVIGKNTVLYINKGNHKLKEVGSFITPFFINNQKSGFARTFDLIKHLKELKKPFVNIPILTAVRQEVFSCNMSIVMR
jgi:Type II intron maturase